MDDAILLEANGLGVRIEGRWIVRDIDLAVRRGEIVTLVGPNGGGKSTIVKALLGLLPASLGSVRRKPGVRIGYVPQKLAIDRTLPLSVKRLMRLTADPGEPRLREALEAVNGAHLAERPVTALSGGELQRVLLARAIAPRPDLLILDEPVQGVDFVGEIALYDLIGRIRDDLGAGVLLVSHDLHVVMARTDRVLCVNGHVCCSGTPQAVSADREYHRLFGPRAADVLALYRHRHDHHHGMPLEPASDASHEPGSAEPATEGSGAEDPHPVWPDTNVR